MCQLPIFQFFTKHFNLLLPLPLICADKRIDQPPSQYIANPPNLLFTFITPGTLRILYFFPAARFLKFGKFCSNLRNFIYSHFLQIVCGFLFEPARTLYPHFYFLAPCYTTDRYVIKNAMENIQKIYSETNHASWMFLKIRKRCLSTLSTFPKINYQSPQLWHIFDASTYHKLLSPSLPPNLRILSRLPTPSSL